MSILNQILCSSGLLGLPLQMMSSFRKSCTHKSWDVGVVAGIKSMMLLGWWLLKRWQMIRLHLQVKNPKNHYSPEIFHKSYLAPKGEDHLPVPSFFRGGCCLNFRGCSVCASFENPLVLSFEPLKFCKLAIPMTGTPKRFFIRGTFFLKINPNNALL